MFKGSLKGLRPSIFDPSARSCFLKSVDYKKFRIALVRRLFGNLNLKIFELQMISKGSFQELRELLFFEVIGINELIKV